MKWRRTRTVIQSILFSAALYQLAGKSAEGWVSIIIMPQKISYLEESLPKESFIRIHRSFIVNRDRIDAYSATDVEIGKHLIPIGRNYKNDVMKVLGKNVF